MNNEGITNEEAEEILIQMDRVIKEYNESHKIKVKWFEVISSLAFIYFEKQNIDIGVIETGMRRPYRLHQCYNSISFYNYKYWV